MAKPELYIPNLNRSRVVYWFLIMCLIWVPRQLFPVSNNLLCSRMYFFSLLLIIPVPTPSSIMFCPLPQHTSCIQQPPLSPAYTYTSTQSSVCTQPPWLCFRVDSAKHRPSQLLEVELPPFPCEFTTEYPCVLWVCVSYFFYFNNIVILCSEIGSTMGVQLKNMCFLYFADLWHNYNTAYCSVGRAGHFDYFILTAVLFSRRTNIFCLKSQWLENNNWLSK